MLQHDTWQLQRWFINCRGGEKKRRRECKETAITGVSRISREGGKTAAEQKQRSQIVLCHVLRCHAHRCVRDWRVRFRVLRDDDQFSIWIPQALYSKARSIGGQREVNGMVMVQEETRRDALLPRELGQAPSPGKQASTATSMIAKRTT